MLKRHDVGDGESELGVDFSFLQPRELARIAGEARPGLNMDNA